MQYRDQMVSVFILYINSFRDIKLGKAYNNCSIKRRYYEKS